MLGYSSAMFIPQKSSNKSIAIGRVVSVVFTLGLFICFGMAVMDMPAFAIIPLALFLCAVVWVIWAAKLDISLERLKKNCPGLFKNKGGSDRKKKLPVQTFSFNTRYLTVPTPPPRLPRLSRGYLTA